jgi:hypothetical protein
MKKLEKARLEKNHLQSDLFIGQVNHMAELIDRFRLQIKEQRVAIIAKNQHIANLEAYIRDLTREIVKIKKYSVFYNLLSRFRKELLMWFGKSRK